jgi:Cu/Ag efflux pump CusA
LSFALFIGLLVALVGGVIAVIISGGILSVGSLFGFLAVLALAIRNMLVMGQHLQRQTHIESGRAILGDAVQEAQQVATPIVTTALAVAAALLPLLIAGNIPGSEIVRPMIGVILGGLVTSLFYTLLVVPAAFMLWPAAAVPAVAPVTVQPALETA